MSQTDFSWGLPHLNHMPVTVYSALLPRAWDKMPFVAQQRYLLEIEALDALFRDGGVIYVGDEDESGGLKFTCVANLRLGEDVYCLLEDRVAPWLDDRIAKTQGETRRIPVALTSIGFVAEGVCYDRPDFTQHFLDIQAYLLDDANRYWVRTADGTVLTKLTQVMRDEIRDLYGEEFLYEERDAPLIA